MSADASAAGAHPVLNCRSPGLASGPSQLFLNASRAVVRARVLQVLNDAAALRVVTDAIEGEGRGQTVCAGPVDRGFDGV